MSTREKGAAMARRATFGGGWGAAGLLYAVAVVLFVLAALGVDVGDFDRIDLLALGLAAFAGGHLL
jgi:hypothetical protein